MAEDVQSNIRVNIDTSAALANIKALQGQLSAFYTSMSKSGAQASATAANLQQNLLNSINATGKFSASIKNISTTTESFTNALEKNKLSLGQYFRYSLASTKTFGKNFGAEFETINKVARERVKDLSTQYIKLGRDANGAMKSIAVRPLTLDLKDMSIQQAIAAQRQQLLNQLLKQGSTNLLNFGKNTQWAGRQLMVGFTIPLMVAGSAAAKAYMDIEKASVNIRKVYGDLNTSAQETNTAVKQIQRLAAEYTKYGVAVADTMDMAAKAAAMGKTGSALLQQIGNATKLAVLGGVDQNQALETTISLTSAFGTSAQELGSKINFLNAVENQTVLNIEDMTTAIPKAAPVVKQLGGNVEDLAYFLTAMKEGGVNASEGANALKSGLSSLINPTKKASDFLAGFGVNVKDIVEKDKGNLKKTVLDFAGALNTLDPLNRARAIEMMFGKFQFARMSTLFQNVTKEGSQASKVLALAGQSTTELALTANAELEKIKSSPLYKFQAAIAEFQQKMAPVGEAFLKAVTPIINFGSKILDGFNKMSDGAKNFSILMTIAVAGIGPVLVMTFGLLMNGVAQVIKGFAALKSFFNRTGNAATDLAGQTSYMTSAQIEAAAVASSLDQIHGKLRQTFKLEAGAVNELATAYNRALAASQQFNGPTLPFRKGKKFAAGGVVQGPGGPTDDAVPANLSNGEVVLSVNTVRKNPGIVSALIQGRKLQVPGFKKDGVAGRSSLIAKFEDEYPGLGKLSQSMQDRVISLIKTTTSFYEELNGNLASHTGVNAAHGNPRMRLSIEEARGVGEQMYAAGSRGRLVDRLRGAAMFGGEGVSAFSNLTFPLPRSANLGEVSGKELSSWITQDPKRFMSMIAENNGMSQDDPGLVKFANDVATKMAAAGSRAITESNFEEIIQSTITEQAEGAAKKALIKSRDTYSTFNVTADPTVRAKREKAQKDVAMLADGSVTTTSGQQSYLRIKDKLKRAGDWARYDTEADNFVKKIIKGMIRSFDSSASETAQTASPSRRTRKIAKDTVDGYAEGLEQGKAKVKKITQSENDLILQQLAIRKKQAEMIGADTSAINKEIAARRQQIAATRQAIIAQERENNLKRLSAIGSSANKLGYNEQGPLLPGQSRMTRGQTFMQRAKSATIGDLSSIGNGKLAGLGVAASMATFALSGMGGVVGQVANTLLPFISLFGAISPLLATFGASLGIAELPLLPIAAGLAAVAAVIGITTLLINQSNEARKKEIERINAGANASKVGTSGLKSLGEFYGTSVIDPYANAAKVAPDRRSAIDKLKETDAFTQTGPGSIRETVTGLKGLGQRASKTALESIGMQLTSQGFAPDAVKDIVTAIQEQAGKTNIKLDFKKMDISTKEGAAEMQANAIKAADAYVKQFNNRVETRQFVGNRGGGKMVTVYDKKTQSEIKTAATQYKGFFTNLLTGLTQGTIKLKTYNQQQGLLMAQIKAMDAQAQVPFMQNIISQMDNMTTAQKNAFNGITNTSYAQIVFQSIMNGASIDPQYLADMKLLGTTAHNTAEALLQAAAAQRIKDAGTATLDSLTSSAAAYQKQLQDQQNQTKSTTKTLKDFIKEQKDAITSAKEQVQAFGMLKKAGMSVAEAYEAIKDKELAHAIVKDGPKAIKQYIALLKLAKLYQELAKSPQQRAADAAQRQNDVLQAKNNQYQAALDLIASKEAKINKTYDDRAAALEKIQSANEEISKQQQDQLDLADALSKGDIAAAARAAQKMRQNAQEKAMADQKTALETARKNQLAGITQIVPGQNGNRPMTRDQIETAIQENTDQINTNQVNIIGPNDITNANTQNNEVQNAVRDKATLYSLAKAGSLGAAGTKIAGDITKAAQTVSGLLKQKQTPAVVTALAKARASVTPYYSALADIAKKIFGYADGGHIQGPGNGTSDSVPAMLSNGEYVIKASSVKKLGVPFLNKLNRLSGFADGGLTTSSYFSWHKDKDTGGAVFDDLMFQRYPNESGVPGTSISRNTLFNFAKKQAATGQDALQNYAAGAYRLLHMWQKHASATGAEGEMYRARISRVYLGLEELYNNVNKGISKNLDGSIMRTQLASIGNLTTSSPSFAPAQFSVSQPKASDYLGTGNVGLSNNPTTSNSSVYNYSINVNVSNSGANANEIANTVMNKIREIDGQRIRGVTR